VGELLSPADTYNFVFYSVIFLCYGSEYIYVNNMIDGMNGKIDKSKIEKFHDDGYIFLPSYYTEEQVKRLQSESNDILQMLIESSIENDRLSNRLNITQREDGTTIVYSMSPFFDLSLLFREIGTEDIPALHQPLLDSKSIALGNYSQLNYKQKIDRDLSLDIEQGSDEWPIHSDWVYFEGWGPKNMLITVVFIDQCTQENGAIEVWPETHKESFTHSKNGQDLEVSEAEFEERLDPNEREHIVGPAGSVLIFDSRLVHSSGPNNSDGPRRVLTYRHAPRDNIEGEVFEGVARPNPSGGGFPVELIESSYELEYIRNK